MAKFGERTFTSKLVGIVDYKSGDEKVKFTLTEDGKTFNGGSRAIKVDLDDLPKVPKIKPNSEGKLRIRMNSDGTEVEALTPVDGVFNAKLIDLGKREDKDSPPTPYVKTWNEGKPNENSYLEFFAVYEITEGKFKGVALPAYKLHYKFEEDVPANPGFTRFAGSFASKKATRLFQLKDWGVVHGLWEWNGHNVEGEPIEWDDETILPELLERAEDADKQVRIVIKNGYPTDLLPLDEEEDVEPFGGDEDDDDLDDATKIEVEEPKKSKKPAPAKVKPVVGGVKKISKKSKSDEDDDDL